MRLTYLCNHHFITRKKSASLIRKLASLTSQEQAKQLNRPVYMEGTAKQDNEAIYYAVDMIHTAIQEKRRIAFQYIEYTAEKEKVLKHDGYRYEFSPYALIWSRDYYYAVGWSEKHGKLAQFRVDRMTAVKLLVQEAIPAQDFDPAAYVHQVFGMFGADIQSQLVLKTALLQPSCHLSHFRRNLLRLHNTDFPAKSKDPGEKGRAGGNIHGEHSTTFRCL